MNMLNTTPTRTTSTSMEDLVADLHAMRDAMLELSLSLKDMQFYSDPDKLTRAIDDASMLIERTQSK